jgi:hypothetical protein
MEYSKIVWSIPVILFTYILCMNMLPFGGSADYLLDIGTADAKVLVPAERVSAQKRIDNITYRELNSSLVYFTLDSPLLNKNSEIGIKVKFKGNFPAKHLFRLGARNKGEWSWDWKNIYVPFYETELENFWLIKEDNSRRVYSTRPQPYKSGGEFIEFFSLLPAGSVIAKEGNLKLELKMGIEREADEINDSVVIHTTLRGPHTLYTYVCDEKLNVTVTKQDLNWYEGTDELEIAVFDLEGALVGNITIPDDGILTKTGERGTPQTRRLTIPKLDNGIYRIDLKCGGDLLITKIESEQDKLVFAGGLFLVGNNPCYFEGKEPEHVQIYFKNVKEKKLEVMTAHECGFQTITINGTAGSETIAVNKRETWFNATMKPSDEFYELQSEKGDILLRSNNYFSFTKSAYFTPQRYEMKTLQNSMDWIEKNGVEYVVIAYQPTEEAADGWKVGRATWNTGDLYVKENKLRFVFGAPHLGTEEFKNNVIPIDWIHVTITTPPIWARR